MNCYCFAFCILVRLCLLTLAQVTNMATANANWYLWGTGTASTLLCILVWLLLIVRYIGAVEVQIKGVQILMLITNTTVWLYYITVPPSHSSKMSLILHQYCVCRWFVPLFMGVNIGQGIRLLLFCKFVLQWLTHAPIHQPYSNSSSHTPTSPLYHHICLPSPIQKWSWEHHS